MITLSEETTYNNIKAALEAGRTILLREKNGTRFYNLTDVVDNQYYGFSWMGTIYKDSQVSEIDY